MSSDTNFLITNRSNPSSILFDNFGDDPLDDITIDMSDRTEAFSPLELEDTTTVHYTNFGDGITFGEDTCSNIDLIFDAVFNAAISKRAPQLGSLNTSSASAEGSHEIPSEQLHVSSSSSSSFKEERNYSVIDSSGNFNVSNIKIKKFLLLPDNMLDVISSKINKFLLLPDNMLDVISSEEKSDHSVDNTVNLQNLKNNNLKRKHDAVVEEHETNSPQKRLKLDLSLLPAESLEASPSVDDTVAKETDNAMPTLEVEDSSEEEVSTSMEESSPTVLVRLPWGPLTWTSPSSSV